MTKEYDKRMRRFLVYFLPILLGALLLAGIWFSIEYLLAQSAALADKVIIGKMLIS